MPEPSAVAARTQRARGVPYWITLMLAIMPPAWPGRSRSGGIAGHGPRQYGVRRGERVEIARRRPPDLLRLGGQLALPVADRVAARRRGGVDRAHPAPAGNARGPLDGVAPAAGAEARGGRRGEPFQVGRRGQFGAGQDRGDGGFGGLAGEQVVAGQHLLAPVAGGDPGRGPPGLDTYVRRNTAMLNGAKRKIVAPHRWNYGSCRPSNMRTIAS